MAGLIAALAAGGATVIAVAVIAAMTIPRLRRSHTEANADPELARAAVDIQSQIDRGRGLGF